MVTASATILASPLRPFSAPGALLAVALCALTAAGCASADCKAGQTCDENGNPVDTSMPADLDLVGGDAAHTDTVTGDATTGDADLVSDADATLDDTTTTAPGDATDSTHADGDSTDTTPTTCLPDNDGLIARAEVPLRTGVNARFRVANDVDAIDLHGDTASGTRTWDLSPMFNASEHLELGELRALDGQWFADTFPDATYFTSFSADYLGVFQATPDALLLLGIVSPDDGFDATEVTYDPPVPILQFPLQVGDSWEASTSASGTLGGFATFYTEDYTFSVDARGDLVTPFATFDVLRVNSELEQWVGAVFTSRRTVAFVTECFGTVATVTSTDYESEPEFTEAAEVRRLAP